MRLGEVSKEDRETRTRYSSPALGTEQIDTKILFPKMRKRCWVEKGASLFWIMRSCLKHHVVRAQDVCLSPPCSLSLDLHKSIKCMKHIQVPIILVMSILFLRTQQIAFFNIKIFVFPHKSLCEM